MNSSANDHFLAYICVGFIVKTVINIYDMGNYKIEYNDIMRHSKDVFFQLF